MWQNKITRWAKDKIKQMIASPTNAGDSDLRLWFYLTSLINGWNGDIMKGTN